MNQMERWLDNWIASEFKKQFDFEGQITLEEFVFRMTRIFDRRGQPVPNPPIQVAEVSDFVWNETIRDQTFDKLYARRYAQAMEKHLSPSAIARYRKMDSKAKSRLLVDSMDIYRNLQLSRQGRSKEPVLNWNHAVRAHHARKVAMSKPKSNKLGQPILTGVCFTCLDCSSCYASRDAKERCNDRRV